MFNIGKPKLNKMWAAIVESAMTWNDLGGNGELFGSAKLHKGSNASLGNLAVDLHIPHNHHRGREMKTPDPMVVDLFCGAGGLSLGAARARFIVRGAVDTDPQSMSAHKVNFKETHHLSTDISRLTGDELVSSLELEQDMVSGIIGGPPCQGFSYMGRKNEDDKRNQLFVDFFRIVADILPPFFLAENVPGIMRSANSVIRKRALSYVEKHYTVLPPLRVSANEYGAPTSRTRIFFIGYLPDKIGQLTEESFQPTSDIEIVRVKNALKGLHLKIDPLWQKESQGWRISRSDGDGYYSSRLHGHVPIGVGDPIALHRLKTECRSSGNLGTLHSPLVSMRYASLKPGARDYVSKTQRLDPDGFCPTLRAGTGPELGSYQAVRPIHPSIPRVITPREAARLQGFPDWFTFSPSKWHSFRQLGSSVSPIIAERLLSVIRPSFDA